MFTIKVTLFFLLLNVIFKQGIFYFVKCSCHVLNKILIKILFKAPQFGAIVALQQHQDVQKILIGVALVT